MKIVLILIMFFTSAGVAQTLPWIVDHEDGDLLEYEDPPASIQSDIVDQQVATEPVDSVYSIDTVDTAEQIDTADQQVATDPVEQIDTVGQIDTVKQIDTVDQQVATEPVDSVYSIDTVDTVEQIDTVKQTKQAKSVKVKQARQSRTIVHWPLSTAIVFPAGFVSYSVRDGYRGFDGVDGYEHIERPDMFMYGGTAGIRLALKKHPRLRFQPLIEIGWGDCEEKYYSELVIGNYLYSNIREKLKLWTLGAQVDAQILFPTLNRNQMLFLSAGPGMHMSTFHHTWDAINGTSLIKTNDMRTVTLSFNLGGGAEWRLSRQRAVTIGYNLRIWEPVYYDDFGDMFPMGTEYSELFLSHTLQLHILLPRSWTVGFR